MCGKKLNAHALRETNLFFILALVGIMEKWQYQPVQETLFSNYSDKVPLKFVPDRTLITKKLMSVNKKNKKSMIKKGQ